MTMTTMKEVFVKAMSEATASKPTNVMFEKITREKYEQGLYTQAEADARLKEIKQGLRVMIRGTAEAAENAMIGQAELPTGREVCHFGVYFLPYRNEQGEESGVRSFMNMAATAPLDAVLGGYEALLSLVTDIPQKTARMALERSGNIEDAHRVMTAFSLVAQKMSRQDEQDEQDEE